MEERRAQDGVGASKQATRFLVLPPENEPAVHEAYDVTTSFSSQILVTIKQTNKKLDSTKSAI